MDWVRRGDHSDACDPSTDPSLAWLEALPQMACLSRDDGTLIVANRRWRAFWGARYADWRCHVHPEDSKAVALALQGGNDGALCDGRFLDANGKWCPFAIGAATVPDGDSGGRVLITAFPVEKYLSRVSELQSRYDLLGKMLDASADCIKILSPDGRLEHMNRAGCQALGVTSETGFGMEWLPLLPEEVRAMGETALEVARSGGTGRFPGKSALPGVAPQFWDNMLTPLMDDAARVSDIICVSRDVTAQRLYERDLVDAKAALQEALAAKAVLAGEMMHRIKNLFAVVTGLIAMAKRDAAVEGAAVEVLGNLKQRIFAMARATELLMQTDVAGSAREFDPLAVSGAVLAPYAGHFRMDGGTVVLPQHLLTSLVLLVHELATNSLKHGAFSRDSGHVDLRWTQAPDTVVLEWQESGGPEIVTPPDDKGFGSGMLKSIAAMSGWTIERDWPPSGLRVRIAMPRP